MFAAIELAIDNLDRRGEATRENIRAAVHEVCDLYKEKP